MTAQLWIPGPTFVRPEIFAASTVPMIGHRTAACRDLIARLDPGLKLAFGVDAELTSIVAAHTTSASGLMEACLRGIGDRVLAIVGGAFGERWATIAESLGKQVTRLEVEWGCTVDPDALRSAIGTDMNFDAVLLVVNETSTGACTSLGKVAEVMAGFPATQLFCDVVSLIAGAPINFDKHRIDFALAGVQKALAVPPGLAVCCASERFLAIARKRKSGSTYLDPVAIIEGHRDRKTPATPALGLYYALAQQLDDIGSGKLLSEWEGGLSPAESWQARFAKHSSMQSRTSAWVASRGLKMLPSEADASPTVSCIKADGLDVEAFLAALLAKGFQIGNGYGRLKNQTFRIGHLGDHNGGDLAALLRAADEVLPKVKSV